MKTNRREFIKKLSLLGASALVSSNSYAFGRSRSRRDVLSDEEPGFLGQSAAGEFKNQMPLLEGALPLGLEGTLYRNGPGIYTRDGKTKTTLIDGDGMIRSYRFTNGEVHFSNKFVKTKKYLEEEAAGRFLYPSWSTKVSNRPFRNFPGSYCKGGTADINVIKLNDRLFALAEGAVDGTWELDPNSLETVKQSNIDPELRNTFLGAHPKHDQIRNEWVFVGLKSGPIFSIEINVFDQSGKVKKHGRIRHLQHRFIHDFFLTEKHIVINLQPLKISVLNLLTESTIRNSMHWEPGLGNEVIIIDRHTLEEKFRIQSEGRFMWHSINAFEMGDEIIADFVGYEQLTHFLGPQAMLKTAMHDRIGTREAGKIRRYRINTQSRQLREELLFDCDNELPAINPTFLSKPNRFAYAGLSSPQALWPNGMSSFDLKTGLEAHYFFEEEVYVSEPIYLDQKASLQNENAGYLAVDSYDPRCSTTQMNLFKADRLSDGPIAIFDLGHRMPVGLHGSWTF